MYRPKDGVPSEGLCIPQYLLYCMYVVLDVNAIFDSNDTTWKVILAIGKTSILNYNCDMKLNIVVRVVSSYPLVYPLSCFISKTWSILAMPTAPIAILSFAWSTIKWHKIRKRWSSNGKWKEQASSNLVFKSTRRFRRRSASCNLFF
jgi:hypothetical protein